MKALQLLRCVQVAVAWASLSSSSPNAVSLISYINITSVSFRPVLVQGLGYVNNYVACRAYKSHKSLVHSLNLGAGGFSQPQALYH